MNIKYVGITALVLAAVMSAGICPSVTAADSLPGCGRVCATEDCGCSSRRVLGGGIFPKSDKRSRDISVYGDSGPLSLGDCYAMSLKQSEVIAMNADAIKIADARFLQALSIMLPHFSFLSNDLQEETPPPPVTSSSTTTSEFETLEPARRSDRRFNVKQTLFNGFKAFAAIKGSKYDKNQRIEEKIRAEQLLLVDVANAFYLLIEKREDVRALRKIEAALTDRNKELRSRERLGRSRPSEIVNAKAQLYSVQSSIEVVRNQAVLARQLLEFLIGAPVTDIVDSYEIPATLQAESYYVAKSECRPDVLAAKYAALVSKQEYRMIDSDFLPTVNLEADGYTQRTGFYKGVDWDVMLRVDVPIFDGGYTLGRSKEYQLKADQMELEFKRKRRRAPFDIKDAYASLSTALAVQESLRKAYTTAKLNYYLQKKDYLRSLVNNLDVLASIQTLQDAQRNYIHALYEAKRLYWQLKVAIGEGMEETLYDSI